jgi:hypothetical protein
MTLNELVERTKELRKYHYVRIISWTVAILLSAPLLILNAYVRHLFGFVIFASTITLGAYLIKNSYSAIATLKEVQKWNDERLKEFPGTKQVNIGYINGSDKEK